MSWFKNNKQSYPTKMFVHYLPNIPKSKNIPLIQEKGLGGSPLSFTGIQGMAIEMMLNTAPKLIDEGIILVSKTINKFAQKDVTKTTVQRNFDIIYKNKISLPSNITLVRGKFAPILTKEGETFGDGPDRDSNQSTLIEEKELHIEIDIIKSKDQESIYFQPKSYFYAGEDREGDNITEIVLAFSFVPIGETIIDAQQVTFQNFVHFENLDNNTQYNFKSETGYDTSFQSSWMNAPLNENVPYTMLIEIQEIREGNSFAKLLQTIYTENKNYINDGLKETVSSLQTSTQKKREEEKEKKYNQ